MSRTAVKMLERFLRSKDGATAIEYALIASLIAAVIVGTLSATGVSVGSLYDQVTAKLPA